LPGVRLAVASAEAHTLPPAWRKLLTSNKAARIGLLLILAVVLTGVAAQWVAPHDPSQQELKNRLIPPFWISGSLNYPLGTDALGRDVLSRILYGSRVSLLVGVVSVLLAGAVGTLLGLVAGYFGGAWDMVIMRLTDAQLAIPFIVLAMALITVTGPSLEMLILVLALNGFKTYCRVVRAEVLSLREREFILASRALGAGDARILFAHLLPNVANSISIVATLTVAQMILAESALSYLGLGIPTSIPSWGNIIADGRDYIATGWWISAMPGFVIVLTVLGVNLVGEWLRERFNPALAEFK
jgi:peptide/nickel transport system permease protein